MSYGSGSSSSNSKKFFLYHRSGVSVVCLCDVCLLVVSILILSESISTLYMPSGYNVRRLPIPSLLSSIFISKYFSRPLSIISPSTHSLQLMGCLSHLAFLDGSNLVFSVLFYVLTYFGCVRTKLCCYIFDNVLFQFQFLSNDFIWYHISPGFSSSSPGVFRAVCYYSFHKTMENTFLFSFIAFLRHNIR